jgi:hypothetical protein
VVTVTGTGWVDPNAASSLEYLHRGNTALAGLQHSYLPSWISFLVDKDEAAEAGIALYRHVHRRWAQLPAGDRPRLVIFGESLGPLLALLGGDDRSRRRERRIAAVRLELAGLEVRWPLLEEDERKPLM